MKNKKLLMFLLAVNTLSASYSYSNASGQSKYDKLYDNMIKNDQTGKSNKKNYELLEEVLSKRNKELKDLYAQSDYIVKPEYLEWQVFFSGFYDHKTSGDNTAASGEYHSDPSYSNGDIKGKTFASLQEAKQVDLGLRIPLKEIDKPVLDLNITPAIPVVFDGNIEVVQFELPKVKVDIPAMSIIEAPSFNFPSTLNGDGSWIAKDKDTNTFVGQAVNYPAGDVAPISQIKLDGGSIIVKVDDNNFDLSMKDTEAWGVWGSTHDETYAGTQNFDWTDLTQIAVMKLVGGHDIGVDNINIDFVGKGSYNTPKMLFHIDAHNSYGKSIYRLGKNTNTNISGENLLFLGIQYHSGSDDAGMYHSGNITTSGEGNIIFATINATGKNLNERNLFFDNDGIINLNGNKEIAGLITIKGGEGYGGKFINNGTLNLNGTNSYGVIISADVTGLPVITLNNPINIYGTGNYGVAIKQEFDASESLIKLNVDGSGGIGIATDINVTNSNLGTLPTQDYMTFKNYELSVGSNANKSTLVSLAKGAMEFDDSGKEIIISGSENFGFIAGEDGKLIINNNITSTGDENLPLVADKGKIQYSGNITTNGFESHGIVVTGNGELTNYGGNSASSIVNGNNSVSIYNEGTVTLNNGGTYKSLGEKGTIVFSNGGNTTIKGLNEYELGNKGIGFYADNGSITLDSNSGTSNIKIGKGSVFSYVSGTGKINFNGNFNVSLDSDAIGFIYQGNGTGNLTQTGLSADLAAKYTGLNNLNINLADSSRLFVLENYGSINMTEATGLSNILGNVSGTGKEAFLWKGKLVVNTPGTIDINNSNELFNKIERSSVGVTIDSGVILSGTQAEKVGLADKFIYSITPGLNDYREMLNNGEINLSGDKSVGIYTDNGFITNNGVITSSGNNGIAVFGENGTVIKNNNEAVINVGNNGIGIYGISYQNPGSVQNYGSGNVDILNKGTVNAVNGNSTGIYAQILSGKSGNVINDGLINIGEKSQGIYLDFQGASGTFKNSNIITSQSGASETVGIYMNNTTSADIENFGNIILDGDMARGIFSTNSGASNILNSGTISVGNSININDPSIGIYSDNISDVITNTGYINAGTNSLGIYSKYAEVRHDSGTISVGSNGTAIYGDKTNIKIAASAGFVLADNDAAAIYGINNSVINNNAQINVGKNNYGIIAQSGSDIINNGTAVLGENSVFIYTDRANSVINNSTGTITTSGSNNIGFYMKNGGTLQNSANIDAVSGISNIGIINVDGTIVNTGDIKVGDSSVLRDKNGSVFVDKSTFAVGIYGAASNISNSGNLSIGKDSVGLYAKDANGTVSNTGNIISDSSGAIGLFLENSRINNSGNITLNGAESIGIAAMDNSYIENTGIITLNGDNSKGVYLRTGSKLDNNGGTITINGENSLGIQLDKTSSILNAGTINVRNITSVSQALSEESNYDYPTLVNAGVINVGEKFIANGMNIVIKIDPSTMTSEITNAEDSGAKFVSDAVKFNAPGFDVSSDNPVIVDPGFTTGTNALAYKLKDVFNPSTPDGGPNSGLVPVKSKSFTWEAIPELNDRGNVDIWMRKIPYDRFTSGLWYAQFGRALDSKYGNAEGEALTIFNKMDFIDNESDFRRITASLAGNVYSNINQRESDIADVFDNSLSLLQNSKNNTKENVKLNIIAGKGKRKENTDGVENYDASHVGILALREVERTYKHTFGYSAGYLHSGFEFKDGNESEEWVDTIQLGLHNKYNTNGWIIKNDLTARASIHNIDRNIDWPEPYKRSEMNGTYETYSFTSDNKLGKEFHIGKNSSVTPYGAFKAMFVTRPTFEEDGLERLKVEGNDAWSAKPRAGVELKSEVSIGKRSDWKVKGTLDLAYEYELANLNEREKAKLVAVEDGYHNLAKPEEEKGQFKTRASIGVEVEDKYGVFITGEYVAGEHDQEDYRAGITLKAVF